MYTIHYENRNLFRRLLASILLVSLLAFSFIATAGAETSTASVSFLEGDLSLGGAAEGSGMNFEFGEHELPAAAVVYETVSSKDHILQVEDARFGSGNWHVTVAMTAFVDSTIAPTSTFDAAIGLKNPALANSNTSAGTTGLSADGDVTIISGLGPVGVLHADDTLPRGIFTATWQPEDVALSISDTDVLKITPVAYTATLTWTLNLGPM